MSFTRIIHRESIDVELGHLNVSQHRAVRADGGRVIRQFEEGSGSFVHTINYELIMTPPPLVFYTWVARSRSEVWHSAPRTGSGCTRVRAALPTNRPRTATREVWHSAPRTGKQLYPSAGSPPDEPAALPTNRLAGWPPAVVHTWVDLRP
jgi:hypothetical protein